MLYVKSRFSYDTDEFVYIHNCMSVEKQNESALQKMIVIAFSESLSVHLHVHSTLA